MLSLPSLQVLHCVVCDDVRTEVGYKETIVGVYTAGMTVPMVPWWVNVCLWMPVIWSGQGEMNLEVRILNPRHGQVGETKGRAKALWQGNESSLTFRGLVFTVEMEGVYEIQWRNEGGGWETVRHFPFSITRT